MIRSPVFRISLGLVMLTISALLFGQLLGVVPNTREAEIESRKVIAESLAVQVSTLVVADNPERATRTLRAVVGRNDSVISIGVRRVDGTLVSQAGNHDSSWRAPGNDKSTATHVVVPLFEGDQRWGSIEVHFRPLGGGGLMRGTFVSLLLFVALAGAVAYPFFLRRVLRELNPDAVIPERVRTALDTLTEGVMILDAREQIVFINQAFAGKIGLDYESLLGRAVEDLDWSLEHSGELPWVTVLRGDPSPGPVELTLATPLGRRYSLVVNVSAIADGIGRRVRGVMATFDDVTELEKANDELRHALSRLENNEKEIRRQNKELQVLATRDPLTGCLNRRSLFQGFETLVIEARENDSPLSCVMVDIDHFKSINDRFGHAMGDKVIKAVADLLLEAAAADDLVGRYGGEEFCLVLPGKDATVAAEHAEDLRRALETGRGSPMGGVEVISASFGVSELAGRVADHAMLMDRADKALYRAKQLGRNRTEIFGCDDAPVSESSIDEAATQTVAVSAPCVEVADTTVETATLASEAQQPTYSEDGVLDRVTGMPGRLLLLDRATQSIERAKRYRHHVAALALSLDALPRVRAALGDMAAEKFREKAVGTIRAELRASDSVGLLGDTDLHHSIARLGSEKIGVLLTDIDDIDLLPRVVQRLQDRLASPQEIAGNEISPSADIGISVYPGDSLDAVTLLRHATSAMHEAASVPGRKRARYYADEINQRSKRRLRLESDLYRAIELEEFVVHYQPKVDIETGRITGMEALARWVSQRTGMVPPDEFIGVAEQIGCMEAISDQVLATVCRQIRAWQVAGLGDVPIAVNLSPVEFDNPGLAERILDHAADAGIDPTLLEVEITENVVMDNAEAAATIMHRLSDAGVRIAVDDFGTGYSTLRCLTQFPVSTIKIDRSFLTHLLDDEQNAAVVTGVTSLAHTLGLTVVAEGVETADQLGYLSDLHCHEAQGYFLSRPVPADAARDLLDNPARIRALCTGDVTALPTAESPAAHQLLGLLNPVGDARRRL